MHAVKKTIISPATHDILRNVNTLVFIGVKLFFALLVAVGYELRKNGLKIN